MTTRDDVNELQFCTPDISKEWFRFKSGDAWFVVEQNGWPNLIKRETPRMIETSSERGRRELAQEFLNQNERIVRLEGEVERLRKIERRYIEMRRHLYTVGDIEIGESTLDLRVTGNCPSLDEFDATLDALAKGDVA